MARREGNAAASLSLDDGVGEDRRWRGRVSKSNRNAITGQHFGRCCGKQFGIEAGVVGHNEAACGFLRMFFLPELCYRLR